MIPSSLYKFLFRCVLFISLGQISRIRMAASYGILRNCQTVFQSKGTNLHSHQYCGLSTWLSCKRICLSMQEMQIRSCIGKIHWRRKRQPTPVFLPRKFHGWRSLASYSPWVTKSQTRLSMLPVIIVIKSKLIICM